MNFKLNLTICLLFVATLVVFVTADCEKIFKVQDEADFEKCVKENTNVVIVFFTAPWCGPCKQQAPLLETAVNSYEGVSLAIVNSDEQSNLVQRYGVRGLPTVFVFKDGNQIQSFVEFITKEKLDLFIKRALGE